MIQPEFILLTRENGLKREIPVPKDFPGRFNPPLYVKYGDRVFKYDRGTPREYRYFEITPTNID